MMKLRLAILSIFTLSVCSFAVAQDYKAPSVKFKKATLKHNLVVDAEVDDYYKYESRTKGSDRQIASEANTEERKPSSLKDFKEPVEEAPEMVPLDIRKHPKILNRSNGRHTKTKSGISN